MENFYTWAMWNGYDDTLTIDRIDNNGNYEPSNCRWATQKQQTNYTRKNMLIIYNGVTHTPSEWAEIVGIKAFTIRARIYRGWTHEEALTIPVSNNNRINKTRNLP